MTTSTYSIDAMTVSTHPFKLITITRRTMLALTIAGAGYVAGAFIHDPASSRSESAAFAAPVQAAEPSRLALPMTIDTVPPAAAVDFGVSNGEQIQDPRECDVAKGVDYACMFMD
jgi:hypothetical protein